MKNFYFVESDIIDPKDENYLLKFEREFKITREQLLFAIEIVGISNYRLREYLERYRGTAFKDE